MLNILLFILIVCPIIAGVLCYVVQNAVFRNTIIGIVGISLIGASLLLVGESGLIDSANTMFGFNTKTIVLFFDFVVLAAMLYFGIRYKHALIILLSLAQIGLFCFFEFFLLDHSVVVPLFFIDDLAKIMILIVSIVGSIICLYSIPYMNVHEEHLHLTKSRQPQFFALLLVFLGAMNGFVLADDLGLFYFFFEVTTICSFLLIGHDKTEIAEKNALNALTINALGGLALLVGIVWIYDLVGTTDIQYIIHDYVWFGVTLIPLALLSLAGLTKAAQMPFQSWLLGAMVAPTPTSALLHSSTMVKAGVYLLLRFSPAFEGTHLSTSIAFIGGFTFITAAALAMGQSNGKKILAYSTISNLGLIVACTGINTEAALAAAMVLLIFHAVSKALLFLCVGTVDQATGSQDIEDMRGLYSRMPWTTLIMLIGILTMMLPPFGMLLGKWMAISAAINNMILLVLLAFGSGMTVVYWSRWAGTLLYTFEHLEIPKEKMSKVMRFSLGSLCGLVLILSASSPIIYTTFIAPQVGIDIMSGAGLNNYLGIFMVYPLFLLVFIGLMVAIRMIKRRPRDKYLEPYMNGLVAPVQGSYIGPMDKEVEMRFSNYYLLGIFGEERLTPLVNFGALMLLLLMFGGSLNV